MRQSRYEKSCSWDVAKLVALSLGLEISYEGEPFWKSNKPRDDIRKIEDALKNAYHDGWADGVKDIMEAVTGQEWSIPDENDSLDSG